MRLRSCLPASLLSMAALLVTATVATPAALAAVSFTPWPASPFERPDTEPSGSGGLQSLDLDADPAPDLLVTLRSTNGHYALPAPSFSPRTFVGSFTTYPSATAVGDVDGDGRRDAFVWGSSDKAGGPTSFVRGTTGGAVEAPGPDYGTPLRDGALGDFDGNGRLDLFASERSGLSVQVQTSGLAFSADEAAGARRLGTPDSDHVAAGDVTGDGKADLLFSGPSQGGVLAVRTAPSLAAAGLAVGVGTTQDLLLANVGGDARPEAVVLTPSGVKVFSISAAGDLGTPTVTPAGVRITAQQSAVGDLDADGDDDVLLATTASDRVIAMISSGDGTFADPQPIMLPGGLRRGPVDAITTADFDRDGDQDIAVSSDDAMRIDVLINGVALPPQPTTTATEDRSYETARATGTVNLRGIGGTVQFEYGETTAYGRTTADQSLSPTPAQVQGVSAPLTGLAPDRTYHVRLVATNGGGTAAGADVEFRTGPAPAADHVATIVEAPARVVAGVPERLRAAANGSFPPYDYAWTFSEDGAAAGADTTHAFAPVPLSGDQALKVGSQGVGDGNTRRGSRKVTLTVTDRFGRSNTAETYVTILPNRAPVPGVRAAAGTLEYAELNDLQNDSSDPDAGPQLEYDRLVRTVFSFGPGQEIEQLATAESQPKVMPWRVFRRDAPAFADIDLGPQVLQRLDTKAVAAAQDRPALLAAAMDQYATAYCAKPALYMYGCWPHPSSLPVSVTAYDRAGASSSKVVDLPIRARARPAAGMTLRNPKVETVTGDAKSANQELPAGISTETELQFDPSTTVVDRQGPRSAEAPVAYVLQIGRPWQLQCGTTGKKPVGGIVQPDLDVPLRAVAREVVLDNPLQGPPRLEAPTLVGGETIGARAAFASRAKAAPLAGGQPGTQVSLGKGCINGVFGVNRPIRTIVSRDPKALRTAIPEAGTWSAMLNVYDRIGARGNVRLDGIVVGPVSKTCAAERKTFPDAKGLHNGFAWTGTCVSSVTSEQLYWTRNAIDLNGVRLAPAPGKLIVIDGERRRVWSANTAPKETTNGNGQPTFDVGKKWQESAASGAPVQVMVDDQPIAQLPALRSAEQADALDGDLKRSSQANKDAVYGGLPYTGQVTVDLTDAPKGCGNGSTVGAQLRLPSVFDDGATKKDQTSPLILPGCNLGARSVISTKGDANLGKPASRAEVARRAQTGVPPVKLDLGGIALGPLEFAKLELFFDPASGSFRGTGASTLMGQAVEVTVAITEGELTEASGAVAVGGPTGVNIPGTPVNLKRITFGVETKPALRFVGGAELTDPTGNIVSVDGTIGFQPSPLKITLDGVGALGPDAAVSLATLHLEVADGEVSISGSAGKSYGPFSYAVNVGGSFSGYGFNVEGSGRACVFACLGVNGVLSDRGAAVCGEIDLWVKTFRPGLGVRWSPFDVDGYLDGCSVAPYRGNIKPAGAAGPVGAAARLTVGDGATVTQGQSLLTAVASSGVPGRPPHVTLNGPNDRVIAPPAGVVDDQNMVGDAVVDVDRIAGTVRFVVPSPTPGDWKIVPAAPSPPPAEPDPPLADVRYAGSFALPAAKSWSVKTSPAGRDLPETVYGTLLSSTARRPFDRTPRISRMAKVKVKGQKKLVEQAVAVEYGNPLRTADLGPDVRRLLKTVKIGVGGLQPRDTVALVERTAAPATGAAGGEASAQSFVQFTVPPSGRIDAEATFLPGVNGAKARAIDAYVTSEDGTPRGVVKGLVGFTVRTASKPNLPPLEQLRSSGKRLKLTFGAAPSVGLKSKALQMKAVVTGKNGSVRVVPIQGSDFKRSGRRYVVTIKAGGATKGASVKLVSVGLGAGTAKGAGKVKTVRVR